METYSGRGPFICMVLMAIGGAFLIAWSRAFTHGMSGETTSTVIGVGIFLLVYACLFGGMWVMNYYNHFAVAQEADKKAAEAWTILGLLVALVIMTLLYAWPGSVQVQRVAIFGFILDTFTFVLVTAWYWVNATPHSVKATY